METKVILFVASLCFCYSDVSPTYFHRGRLNRFGYRSPPMQPFFPLFPKFYLSNPILTKPPPPAPAPVPDIDRIVRFNLYTRQNKHSPEEIHCDRKRTQPSSYFKVNRKTKILIHGFVDSTTDSTAGEWMNFMRDAYLNAEDVNVIVVDYSFIALLIFYWTNLPQMSSTRIAELIYFLNSNGSPYDSFHLIGRSWGAHVAGMAGHTLSGKLGRITGLDPVNPPFRFVGFQYRLDKMDAKFVDVYHLNGRGRFNLLDIIGVTHRYGGLSAPMGHVDIYPNHQIREETGCAIPNANYYTASCRLGVGARIFTETIDRRNVFMICPCETFMKYIKGDCRCDMRNSIEMGEYMSQKISGVYQISEVISKPTKPKPIESVPVVTTTTTTTTTTTKPSEDVTSESTTSTSKPSEDVPNESTTSTTLKPSEDVPNESTTSAIKPSEDVLIESTSTTTTITTTVPESITNESTPSTTLTSISANPTTIESTSTTSTPAAVSVDSEIMSSESSTTSTTTESSKSESTTAVSTSSSSNSDVDESNLIIDNSIPSESSSTEGSPVPPAPEEAVPAVEISSTASTTTSTEPAVAAVETSELPTDISSSTSEPSEDRLSGISLSEDGQTASSSALGRRQ